MTEVKQNRFQVIELGDLVDELRFLGDTNVLGKALREVRAGSRRYLNPAEFYRALLETSKGEYAELLISSKGQYMYGCFCGTTSNGNMRDIDLFNANASIDCLNYACNRKLPAQEIIERIKRTGGLGSPRVFLIRPPLEETD